MDAAMRAGAMRIKTFCMMNGPMVQHPGSSLAFSTRPMYPMISAANTTASVYI